MGSKDKAKREVRKPKKDKKAKQAATPNPIIPPSARQSEPNT
jgi:hypothetical protein